MGSNRSTTTAFLLVLTLLFLTLCRARHDVNASPPQPQPKPTPPQPKPTPPQPKPAPPQLKPAPPQLKPAPLQPKPAPPQPKLIPPPQQQPQPPETPCPRDAIKFSECSVMIGGLINKTIGTPPVTPCCSFIKGVLDFEAAICLCTAIKLNLPGLNIDIPIAFSFVFNVCSKTIPPGFKCA